MTDNKDNKTKIGRLDNRLANIEDQLRIFLKTNKLSEIDNFIMFFNAQYKEIEKKYDEVENIRGQLFAVLALFFGLFTFLSCDIAFSKNFLSYLTDKQNKVHLIYLTLAAVIVFQIVYIVCIYRLIIKPFLKKIS